MVSKAQRGSGKRRKASSAPTREQSKSGAPRSRTRLWQFATLLLVAVVCYANSLRVPFQFDDIGSIPENDSIRRLNTAFSPPAATTVAGRPLLNATFALNYALGRLNPTGYHVLNLAIHCAMALLLCALIARMLQMSGYAIARAQWLAFATALLWVSHPLNTEAVTYTVHRAESMGSLLIVCVVYCAARSIETKYSSRWQIAAVLACAAAILTKEIGAVAPVLVLAFDWLFIPGTWRGRLKTRRWLYVGLFACWGLMLAVLGGRKGSAGFDLEVGPLAYARTQAQVLVHYLRLCIWPHPLLFDYGWPIVQTWAPVVLPGAVILAGLGATGYFVFRRSRAAFAGVVLFVVLAPTSSFIPIVTEVAAERRMYLPLAALLALTVIGVDRIVSTRRAWLDRVPWAGPVLLTVLVLVSASLCIRRNRDYASPLGIWEQVLRYRPLNPRAHYNHGFQLEHTDRSSAAQEQALAEYRHAFELKPDFADAYINAGYVLAKRGQFDDALDMLKRAVDNKPGYGPVHNNYGQLLAQVGRKDEALAEYARAVQLAPWLAKAHYNYANALTQAQQLDAAIPEYREAIRLQPGFPAAYLNLGNVLAQKGDNAEVEQLYRKAIELDPNSSSAHYNLGAVFARQGRNAEAEAEFRAALRVRPDYALAQEALDNLLAGGAGQQRPQ